jgi:steroid delta-isomerase-like uncharacterized protein
MITGCESTKEASLEKRNKELIRVESEEIGTKGNLEIIDDLFSVDIVRHFLPDGSKTRGLQELRNSISNHRQAFPDWAEEIKQIVAEGDFVAIRWTSTGTNTGSFRGNPPTGQKIQTNDMSIFRIVDGKIIEQWLLPDLLSMNQQLDLISKSESSSDINNNTSQTRRTKPIDQASSKEQNKEIVRRDNEEIWNKGNLDMIDELYSADFVRHFLPTGSKTQGLEELRNHVGSHRQAFPDWAEEIKQIVAESDLVVTHFSSSGTNEGSFMGNPPTGKKIHISEMSIVRIADGKIVEQWLLPDLLSLNQQLGFIPK